MANTTIGTQTSINSHRNQIKVLMNAWHIMSAYGQTSCHVSFSICCIWPITERLASDSKWIHKYKISPKWKWNVLMQFAALVHSSTSKKTLREMTSDVNQWTSNDGICPDDFLYMNMDKCHHFPSLFYHSMQINAYSYYNCGCARPITTYNY